LLGALGALEPAEAAISADFKSWGVTKKINRTDFVSPRSISET
jgi:hypothetical protein